MNSYCFWCCCCSHVGIYTVCGIVLSRIVHIQAMQTIVFLLLGGLQYCFPIANALVLDSKSSKHWQDSVSPIFPQAQIAKTLAGLSFPNKIKGFRQCNVYCCIYCALVSITGIPARQASAGRESEQKSTRKFTDKNKSLLLGKKGHFGGLAEIPALQQLPTFRQ